MEHVETVRRNTVERYVLGELTASERDAFEEHFFECQECAADVKAMAAFIDNVRVIMRRDRPARNAAAQKQEKRSGWLGWLQPAYAMAAIAALLLLIAYQSFIAIPRIKREVLPITAQALPTLSLTTSGSRGDAAIPEIALQPDGAFGIYVDVPESARFTAYSCVLRASNGNEKFRVEVGARQAHDTVELLVPGGALVPGLYQLVVFGHRAGNESSIGEEIARYPFAVKDFR